MAHLLSITFLLIIRLIITECKCKCVQPEQCGHNYGAGLLDVRVFQNDTCVNRSEICCNLDEEIDEAEKPIGICGFQNYWSASLFFKANTKGQHMKYKCGVSLINQKAVITAAHCLSANGSYSIRIGKISRPIAKVIFHPDYKPATLHNDIAIIILTTPILLNRRITTNCIAEVNYMIHENTICQAASWVTKHSHNRTFTYLKIMKVKIILKNHCLDIVKSKTRLGNSFKLHDNFICATPVKEEKICEGDGGSPLICPIEEQPGRHHQVGLVSWGVGCQNGKMPGMYVSLTSYRDWIDEEMRKNKLEINSYTF